MSTTTKKWMSTKRKLNLYYIFGRIEAVGESRVFDITAVFTTLR